MEWPLSSVYQRLHAYPIQNLIPWWMSGALATGFATALGLVFGINPTAAAVLFVLSVVAAVSVGKLRAALLTSALSFISLNYFFTPPRRTFAVEKAEDLVALLVFLVVAVVVSSLFSSLVAERGRAERVDREARLARLESEASSLRAALFSAVTHDLKTPITSIKASAGSLMDPMARVTSEDAMDLLEGIVSEAERLNRLVENVLDLARLEAGALELCPVEADVLDLIGVVLRRVRPAMNGHMVEVAAQQDLPEFRIDINQIEHVLINILENAARFSPPSSKILVRVSSQGRFVNIQVEDHGPGIPPSERSRVVEPFYRMERDRHRSGSGLGLAIVSAMVKAHGGDLRLEETQGGGTTVIASLPVGSSS